MSSAWSPPPASLFAPRVLVPVLADAVAGLAGVRAEPANDYALSPAAVARLRALPPTTEQGVA